EGVNPELEISRHLTAKQFTHVPALGGAIQMTAPSAETGTPEASTLAIVHALVPNEGDAWSFTVDELERYFERVLAARPQNAPVAAMPHALVERAASAPPEPVASFIGGYRDMARLLGCRTAELHVALADAADNPAFAPEPFTPFSRRSSYQSLRNLTMRVLDLLQGARDGLSEQNREMADVVLAARGEILARFSALREDHRRIASTRIRVHGDY